RAPEPEEPVAALDADARRGAPGPDAAHDQAVLGARGLEAEELPGELVGARGGEGRGGEADVLVAALAPERQHDAVALGVVLDALPEPLWRGHLGPGHFHDRVAAGDAGGLGRALRLRVGYHRSAAYADVQAPLRGPRRWSTCARGRRGCRSRSRSRRS